MQFQEWWHWTWVYCYRYFNNRKTMSTKQFIWVNIKCGIHQIVRSLAVNPSPALLTASLRSSRVAKLVLPRSSPGAHWSHWASIASRKLLGAPFNRRGLAWILSSSLGRNPRPEPISCHFEAYFESCWERQAWCLSESLVSWLLEDWLVCCCGLSVVT